MADLKILNNLGDPNGPAFEFSDDEGSTWKIPCHNLPPANLPESFEYRFRISKRIHNSSIAVSLKGFTHTIELVDKCLGTENYVLLRFVPKPDESDDPVIKIEALSSPKNPAANSFPSLHCTEIQFQNFRYQRDAILKKTGPNGLIFSAQCSCLYPNTTHIGALSPKETLDICLDGIRSKNLTVFRIFSKALDYDIKFVDNQNFQNGGTLHFPDSPYIRHILHIPDILHIPHIEVIVRPSKASPENVNITIHGDE